MGFRDAGHATALGKCILASLDQVQLDDYLASRPLPDLTPHTMCVAAPVRAGDVVAAVALSLPARRQHELASLAEPLRYTAERISRAIALPN